MGSYLIFFITCVRWLLIYVSWDRAFKRKCLISDILWKQSEKSCKSVSGVITYVYHCVQTTNLYVSTDVTIQQVQAVMVSHLTI